MLKRVLAAGAASVLIAGSALAAKVPTNEDECNAMVETIGTAVAEKDLGPKDGEKVEALLDELTKQCADGKYQEAAQTSEQIRGMLASE